MRDVLRNLEPKALWRYFDLVSDIPRCSGSEERIQAALEKVAKDKGLATRRDAVGNLVVVIPAKPGCEKAPTVVLQGHVDMVCEKNSDCPHDFNSDPIQIVRDGEWITAKGTTLGGDNGVAVAAALALTEDAPPKHGKLELLFTVDEERGLTGAAGIEPHMVSGRMLLNLDSEEEGFVTVGCAGGGDTRFEVTGRREPLLAGWETMQFAVKGLRGGHSGIDIHENRANSLRCLGRWLDRAKEAAGDLRLASLRGGSKRNAIPREAFAVVALPAGGKGRAEEVRAALAEELKVEFGPTDPGLSLTLEPATSAAAQPFTSADSAKLVALLLATPTGVIAMSRDIPGLVETSTNLGVAETNGDTVAMVNCTRSAIGSARDAATQSLRLLGEAAGAKVTLEGGYPGWKPDLSSKLLARFKTVHQRVTGKPPQVLAIHAGLECGILGERFPGMDMISFGPDLKGVHAPGEKLHITSTKRFFDLLKVLLADIAGAKITVAAKKAPAGKKQAKPAKKAPKKPAKKAAKKAVKGKGAKRRRR